MEKIRVKKGDLYYFISYNNGEFTPIADKDWGNDISKQRYDNNNYFYTEEEAEAMAKKMKAVMQGADVIEMPSEEEITDKIFSTTGEVVGPEGEITVFHCMKISNKVLEWLKSKIIK